MSVDPRGLNKSQRASLTVSCPTCSAGVGDLCSSRPMGQFSHIERFVKANRIGRTGRRGDPQHARYKGIAR